MRIQLIALDDSYNGGTAFVIAGIISLGLQVTLARPTTGERIHVKLLRPLLKSQKAFVLSRNTAKVRASPADMGGLGR